MWINFDKHVYFVGIVNETWIVKIKKIFCWWWNFSKTIFKIFLPNTWTIQPTYEVHLKYCLLFDIIFFLSNWIINFFYFTGVNKNYVTLNLYYCKIINEDKKKRRTRTIVIWIYIDFSRLGISCLTNCNSKQSTKNLKHIKMLNVKIYFFRIRKTFVCSVKISKKHF